MHSPNIKPQSVNYHFTRVCNYNCGFCFHTSKTTEKVPLEKAKEGLKMIAEAGMQKINFAGGEPFLYPQYLGELVKFCKKELHLNVSIVSNGSKVKRAWFEKYGQYLDILAISCDSFNEKTNKFIGRGTGNHLEGVKLCSNLCLEFGVKFKLNTVVTSYTWEEDMNEHVKALNPHRWKVFQVLLLEGENTGEEALRNGEKFLISDDQFQAFLKRHSEQACLVPEDNNTMKNSYLILDEFMRFLNCTEGKKEPSQSIFDVGVQKALQQSGFDHEMFLSRGGIYDWNRETPTGSCNSVDPKLEW